MRNVIDMSEPTGPLFSGKRSRINGLIKGRNEFPYVTKQKEPDNAQSDSSDSIFPTAQWKHVSDCGRSRLLRFQVQ